jgi:hypothetical protein
LWRILLSGVRLARSTAPAAFAEDCGHALQGLPGAVQPLAVAVRARCISSSFSLT